MANSQAEIDTTIHTVIGFLIEKTHNEGQMQTKYNPTSLGGVIFWFEEVATGKIIKQSSVIGVKDNSPETEMHLKFSVHPNDWKIAEIVHDLNMREREMLIQKGIGIHRDY